MIGKIFPSTIFSFQKILIILLLCGAITILFIDLLLDKNQHQNSHNWSYEGNTNPSQWGKISSDFALCELGTNQSPINISNPKTQQSGNLEFYYQPSPLSVVDTGHSIQGNYQSGSKIIVNSEEYELLQFHFHTPSEHQINSQVSLMEMHLVHRSNTGKLAVVGVMIEKGKFNPVIEQIISHQITESDNSIINAADLLPAQKSYFSYIGSLTTPPCSENVKWHILQQPIQVSENQIKFFQGVHNMNARPVQTVNNRVIDFYP
jgi:carbonic anhydrase